MMAVTEISHFTGAFSTTPAEKGTRGRDTEEEIAMQADLMVCFAGGGSDSPTTKIYDTAMILAS